MEMEKTDVAQVNRFDATLSVFPNNVGSIGPILPASFNPKIDFTTGTSPIRIAAGDLDGDGLIDLAVSNYNDASVSVYRNISTPGNIQLETKVDFVTGSNPVGIGIIDFDGDGKLEIATANQISGSISVLRNLSAAGSFTAASFAPSLDVAVAGDLYDIALGDIDTDGKPDMVVSITGGNGIAVIVNTSVNGTLSFASPATFGTGNGPRNLTLADLNADGKLDVVVSHPSLNVVGVSRNVSTPGTVSLSGFGTSSTGSVPFDVEATDIDGDGKPDLMVTNETGGSISVIKNSTTGIGITFEAAVNFTADPNPYKLKAGDIDGDGRPEIVVVNQDSNQLSFLSNLDGGSAPTITSFSPVLGNVGASVTITGTGFDPTPGNNIVYFGAVLAVVNSATPTSLDVEVPPGATHESITVTTSGLTAYSRHKFDVTFSPVLPIDNSAFDAKVGHRLGCCPLRHCRR